MTTAAVAKTNGNGAAVARPQGQMSIKDLLETRKDAFAQLLPRHLSADRLIKVALGCIAKTPKLQQCTASSLLQAVIVAAELGLEPGGALGHLYLVPYGNTCTPIVGYRGFIELMRRSGQLAQIEAHVVHEHDTFEVEFGLSPKMRHVPKLDGDAGKPLLVYALARLKDGSVHCEVMTIEDVEKVRKRSRAAGSGPWVTDYEEMAKKTVVRRAAKYLPMSAEVARAMEVDDADVIDVPVVPIEVDAALAAEASKPAQPEAKGNAKAKAALAAKNPKAAIIDVIEGETEEAAKARINGEPPDDVVLPTNEPPPPGDEDAPTF